jgi:hypothetical protein
MMSKKLENFIEQHKDAFNDYEPSEKLWNKLEKELNNKQVITMQQATVKKLAIYKWVAAASVTLLIGLSIFYFTKENIVAPNNVVKQEVETPAAIESIIKLDTPTIINSPVIQQKEDKFIAKQVLPKEPVIAKQKRKVVDTLYDEMIAFAQTQKHFATLITYKEKEIKNLSKADTNVFKSFAADMEGLNKSYQQLNTQLPKTHNKSALINAMIYNLQIQIDLLNKQLIILNKIESSQKKQTYENNI